MTDENDCRKCTEALTELENIDDETDNLDITFVKIKDARYARKYGINKLPALVYFRKRFPSIYRGQLLTEFLITQIFLRFLFYLQAIC
jgi:hypothetical protein